MSEPNFRDFV